MGGLPRQRGSLHRRLDCRLRGRSTREVAYRDADEASVERHGQVIRKEQLDVISLSPKNRPRR
ncbi:hypothetical protein XAC3810_210007 [Xanthomonas citri pv. citri]|nr:hypothetical protein XAC3824_180007 [Xanthomonas citri pv. citri]CEE20271.1 hypothetical protein XAC1083_190007 [Xanthomonas citri pv. citri]CEE28526.1 hypothetical protein XAC3810_210007 [Xanthomonas citri pv. citri]CEE31005.1 hypothetical protein XAC2911_180003 [Xanthomonas citri pv. citri]CEE34605.1 hypothetical protein XAC908_290007 [Xanthomonas citri pv. citri]